MPRIYLTPEELLEDMPIGITLASQLAQLPNGTVDRMLARASQRVDTFCEKRMGAPGTTTISDAGGVSAGAMSINVASTLTLDMLAEQAVMLDIGLGTQETVLIQPGGVKVTTPWVYPYPGTLTLATPLQFGHSQGGSVQYVYQEVSEVGRASMSDPYSEALQSQAAQLALAHLPPVHVGLNRICFTKNYPIVDVYEVDHSYSFDTTYNIVYQSNNSNYEGQLIIEPTAGFWRWRVGTVILPEGFIKTTYTAGYQAIPEDIKDAVVCYLKDILEQFPNPYGAVKSTMGKRQQDWTKQGGKSPNVQDAEAFLQNYRRWT